jgi:hypothetical protein
MTLQIMINPNERNWQNTTEENGDSLVNDGGTLTNLVVQLDVLSNVYKYNFNHHFDKFSGAAWCFEQCLQVQLQHNVETCDYGTPWRNKTKP